MSHHGAPDAAGNALWDEVAPALWREHGDRIDVMDGPAGAAMLQAARLRSGDRVLDVGCGAGATTVEAARQVGPTGTVVGVDISPRHRIWERPAWMRSTSSAPTCSPMACGWTASLPWRVFAPSTARD